MDQIIYLFILFSILFLIEKKAINILICYVGIIITLAILINLLCITQLPIGWHPIGNFYGIRENPQIHQLINNENNIIDGQYYSYILILVQVSALTILFGFIIMLYPTLSITKEKSRIIIQDLKAPIEGVSNTSITLFQKWKERLFRFNIIQFCFIILCIFSFYKGFWSKNIFYTNFTDSLIIIKKNIWFEISDKYIYNEDSTFLRKLGYYLYQDEKNIIKLLLITIILLFAILALFFLI